MFASLVKLAALVCSFTFAPAPIDAPAVLGASDIGPYLPPVTIESPSEALSVDVRVLDCYGGPFGGHAFLTALSLPTGVADSLIADGTCGIRGVRLDGSLAVS